MAMGMVCAPFCVDSELYLFSLLRRPYRGWIYCTNLYRPLWLPWIIPTIKVPLCALQRAVSQSGWNPEICMLPLVPCTPWCGVLLRLETRLRYTKPRRKRMQTRIERKMVNQTWFSLVPLWTAWVRYILNFCMLASTISLARCDLYMVDYYLQFHKLSKYSFKRRMHPPFP